MISHKFLTTLPVQPLQHQLAEASGLWGSRGFRKAAPGSPHAEMVDIWARFRAFDELTEPARYREPHVPTWYPEVEQLPQIPLICRHIMKLVDGEILGGVLLTKLQPGGKIERHNDRGGWHSEFYTKFYVAVKNPRGAKFGWDDGEIEANTGDVWWFNNLVDHWVTNDTDEERISMIVCIRTPQGPLAPPV